MRNCIATTSILALVAGTPALAQPVPPRDGAWRGSVGAGFTNTTGNTDSFNAALSADAVRRTDVNKMTGKLLGVYGRTETNGVKELTASLIRANARYDRDISEITYGFLGYDLEKDKLADLKWRNNPSLGVGLHLRRTPSYTFDVFTGYSYNHEQLYDGAKRSFNEVMLGEETSHKFGADTSFTQRLVVYPNLSESGEYRLSFDAGLIAPVIDRWNVTLKYSLRYQSNPPLGVEKQDTVLYAGLQYSWGPQ